MTMVSSKKVCFVAIVPVSVPLSNLIMDGITLVSYKYSKYQRPMTLGLLLVTQTRSHNSIPTGSIATPLNR